MNCEICEVWSRRKFVIVNFCATSLSQSYHRKINYHWLNTSNSIFSASGSRISLSPKKKEREGEYKSLTLPLSAGETPATVWSRFQAWLKQEVKRWSIVSQPPLFGGFFSPCGTVTCRCRRRRRQPTSRSDVDVKIWSHNLTRRFFFPLPSVSQDNEFCRDPEDKNKLW